MDQIIENHIAEYTLRIANAYTLGNLSQVRRLEAELKAYKEIPRVKVYLLQK